MNFIISLAIFFSAVIIHEFSHAFVAYKFGDSTAQRMGRLTLNPLAHIDPFGTVLLPLMLYTAWLMGPRTGHLILFGWAKPVPINFASLKNPKRDMIWVGLAGPMANILFALCASLLFKVAPGYSGALRQIIELVILFNIILAVFNLIPIPPLDGSRVLMGLLPIGLAVRLARMERYGILIIFALVYLGVFRRIVFPIAIYIFYLLINL